MEKALFYESLALTIVVDTCLWLRPAQYERIACLSAQIKILTYQVRQPIFYRAAQYVDAVFCEDVLNNFSAKLILVVNRAGMRRRTCL